SFSKGALISVVSAATPPPVPALLRVIFGNSGVYLTAEFDSPTDKASLLGIFACSKLFSFAGSEYAQCQWKDDTLVSLTLSVDKSSLIYPERMVSLLPNVLRAKCRSAHSICAQYEPASAIEVAVSPPAVIVAPVVTINVPVVIGACDDMVIDFSPSRGSGGRAWKTIALNVDSSDKLSKKHINAYIANLSSLSAGRVILKNNLLKSGASYVIHVKLCNFYSSCSTGTVRVAVSNSVLPLVTIFGETLRTNKRSTELLLSGSAFVTLCDGTSSSKRLTYSWVVTDSSGAVLPDVKSVSLDPQTFLLPPNQLVPGEIYKFTLRARHLDTEVSGSAYTHVSIPHGDVVAVIIGGSERSTRVGEILILDGSLSFDEDEVGSSGSAAKESHISYLWSCYRVLPSYSTSCGVELPSNMNSSILRVSSAVSHLYQQSSLSLTVVGSGGRSSVATVLISVDAVDAPVVKVSSTLSRINTHQKLFISGVVSSRLTGFSEWSVNDTAVNLESSTRSAIKRSFLQGAAESPLAVNLIIDPNALYAGGSFTFSLIYHSDISGQTSRASVAISTNAPPTVGKLDVDPVRGEMMYTQFTCTALNWIDEDLPISYEYAYAVANSDSYIVLRSKLQNPFFTTVLPEGSSTFDFKLSIRVVAFDALGASSSSKLLVTVNPIRDAAQSRDATERIFDESLTGESTNNDELRRSLAFVGALLNSANCSLAGNYVSKSTETRVCSADRDCTALWESCVNGLCKRAPKSCAGNCSGHGACIIASGSSRLRSGSPSCLVGDTDCVARCFCEEGFAGTTCSYTSSEFEKSRGHRLRLLVEFKRLVENEDPREDTVEAWAGSLAMLTLLSDQLSEASTTAAASVMNTVLRSAAAAKVPYTAAIGVINAVTAILSAGS
ncbi:unnamed protein product, partial [Ectocarpus fasciculatus]